MIDLKTEYAPNSVSPPGDTLLETLEVIGMTQAELATRMGRPKKTINEIIKGKTAITPETALQLELALDIPASFWNERERRYQEALARVEQDQQLSRWVDWLDKAPYQELTKLGWITEQTRPIDRLRTVLSFFGVTTPEQWETLWKERAGLAFRQSQAYSIDEISAAAWLRKSETEAKKIDCSSYNGAAFQGVLQRARFLSREKSSAELYLQKLPELCRTVGVAVTIVPRMKKSRAYGASQWLSPQKAHIALSLYRKYDDQFWFSFFHEAAHILLHSKKEIFINNADGVEEEKSIIEEEADTFARNFLIPSDRLDHFIKLQRMRRGRPYLSADAIRKFATEIGVAPSIVVGRLQRDGVLEHSWRNELRTILSWDDEYHLVVKRPANL